jgi:hypothetical protein
MAGEDSKSVGIAVLLLAIVDAVLLYIRLTGNPLFQLSFEALVFYFPLLLLVIYWVYLRIKLQKF